MSRKAQTTPAGPKVLRCAIYTRKSSDEGLEQSFNSLHAQREASEAYIKSQAHEGWEALPTGYDDGGFSGGNMERPALKALLSDIKAGKVDVVVVYKIDRLTRSLMDFSRIVDVFDEAGVSFVSITQAFNTTTSMGRLTLNVLLSFAQFEREVTGERIRDKIAQSKAKGMWMGGNIMLGYDLKDRSLVVNEAEANLLRSIFARYLRLGSVHRLRDELEAEGLRSKSWVSTRGQQLGGKVFSRGALYHLLSNRHYLGQIKHRDQIFPGQHPAIISQATFDKVQTTLGKGTRGRPRSRETPEARELNAAKLTGRLFDAEGDPMSPTISHGRNGKIHRYYVSSCLQNGVAAAAAPSLGPRRAPAPALEAFVLDQLRRLAQKPAAKWCDVSGLLRRVDVRPASTELVLEAQVLFGQHHPELALSALRRRLEEGEEAVVETGDPLAIRIHLPVRLQFRGGRCGVVKTDVRSADLPGQPDPTLIKGLRTAHALLARHDASPMQDKTTLSRAIAPDTAYERRLCRLAFLAPDLQQAILDGRHPIRLTIQALVWNKIGELPLDWEAQRRWWRSLT